MKRKILAIFLVISMALFAMIGCANGNGGAAEAETPAATEEAPAADTADDADDDEPFFVGLAFGGLDATPTVLMQYLTSMMDELGWRYVVTNGDLDFNKYISDVEGLVQQQPDLLMTRAINHLAVPTVVEMANAADVPILIMSDLLPAEGLDYLGHVGDPELLRGIPLAQWLNEYIEANPGFVPRIGFLVGDIAIDARDILERSYNIRDYLEHEFVDVVTGEAVPNWMASGAMSVTEDWLQRFTIDELNTILVWSDEMAVGVVQALQAAGKEPGDILVLSYDGLPLIMDYVEQGWVSATSGIDLRRQAEIMIEIAQQVKDGNIDQVDFLNYAMSIYIMDQSNVAGLRDGTIRPVYWDYSHYLSN